MLKTKSEWPNEPSRKDIASHTCSDANKQLGLWPECPKELQNVWLRDFPWTLVASFKVAGFQASIQVTNEIVGSSMHQLPYLLSEAVDLGVISQPMHQS